MVKLFLRVYFSEINTNNRCILVAVSGEVALTQNPGRFARGSFRRVVSPWVVSPLF